MIDDDRTLPVPVGAARVSTVAQLAEIPEEEIWLQKQKSARTRRAYRLDVQHFMATLHIGSIDELRQADHKAVIAWERYMREVEHAAASTIRRRLAALSLLFRHLIDYGGAARNPAREVARPAINRQEGATLAFSKVQARKLLDLPAEDTIAGLRDRAILSVGLQVGLRRAEIAALKVGDLHQNRGYDSLKVARKGGRRDALAINPQTAARLRAYLDAAGHAADSDGPMFRPLKHNGKRQDERRRMDPDAIDRVVRKYAAVLGLDRGYSAHSMRATFITTALENGAQLEDVQKAAGHRDPNTTKLYDRRGYNPEKAASFFATYWIVTMRNVGRLVIGVFLVFLMEPVLAQTEGQIKSDISSKIEPASSVSGSSLRLPGSYIRGDRSRIIGTVSPQACVADPTGTIYSSYCVTHKTLGTTCYCKGKKELVHGTVGYDVLCKIPNDRQFPCEILQRKF